VGRFAKSFTLGIGIHFWPRAGSSYDLQVENRRIRKGYYSSAIIVVSAIYRFGLYLFLDFYFYCLMEAFLAVKPVKKNPWFLMKIRFSGMCLVG